MTVKKLGSTVSEYMVIRNGASEKFAAEVNEAIQAGWQPLGGVTTGQRGEAFLFIQAMVR